MAFRHYGGTPKPVSAVWKCPSCGAENTGALEAGCEQCKAGADARVKVSATPPLVVQSDAAMKLVESAFEAWRAEALPYDHIADMPQLLAAFIGGVRWAQGQQGFVRVRMTGPASSEISVGPSPTDEPQGGWTVALVPPDTKDPALVDSRTEATLLAALVFYRDNQLVYGPQEGQLTADEITELIEKLTPTEVPHDSE